MSVQPWPPVGGRRETGSGRVGPARAEPVGSAARYRPWPIVVGAAAAFVVAVAFFVGGGGGWPPYRPMMSTSNIHMVHCRSGRAPFGHCIGFSFVCTGNPDTGSAHTDIWTYGPWHGGRAFGTASPVHGSKSIKSSAIL